MTKPKLHTIISGYFPNALEAVAHHAQYGNDKHNGAGAPLHWAFNKSTEHAESAQRHLQKAGTIDPETGKSHTVGLAIRALMLLETELLAAGAEPGWAVDMGEPCAEPCEACEEAKEPYEAPPERWRVTHLGGLSFDCPDEYPSQEAAREAIRNNPRRWKGAPLSDWAPVRIS